MQAWTRWTFPRRASLPGLRGDVSHLAWPRSGTVTGKRRATHSAATAWTSRASASWWRAASAAPLRESGGGYRQREENPDHGGTYERFVAAFHSLETFLDTLVRTPREVEVSPYIVAGADSSARNSPSIAESSSLSALSVEGESAGTGLAIAICC